MGLNDEDTISRQQAIDALDKHIDTFDAIDKNYLSGVRTAMSILKEMPSAQPETHEERTETHACDCISRRAAIDAISAVFPVDPNKSEYASGIACGAALALTYIKQLPSAQPHWIPCSERLQIL